MTPMPLPDATPGYAAARLDDTTLLVDLLAVSDIMNYSDTIQYGDHRMLQNNRHNLEPIPLAGTLQSLADRLRPQVLVIKTGSEIFALGCNEIRVLPASKVNLQPLRSCMSSPVSLFDKVARIGEITAFYCDAGKLGALIKKLVEHEHGKLESNPD